MQALNKEIVSGSGIPEKLVVSLEKLLHKKTVKKKLTIGGRDYTFLGLVSNDVFISFPLLDMCVIQNSESDVKYFKGGSYQVKVSNFFLNVQGGVETEKSFFVIDTCREYLDYLSTLKSKYRSQMNNIKHPFSYSIINNFTKGDVDLFYDVYIRRMREIGALPMPKSFFYNLTDSEEIFFSKVVDNNCRAVSIALLIKGVIHLLWAASDNRQSANLFMYRELIKFCCDDDRVQFLNIGRATNNSSQYKFKERIGGEKFPIREFTNKGPTSHYRSRLPKYMLKLYRIVPLFFIRALSRIIYKRVIR